jgi:glycosyltransferase involved in cell wall biosynthesis
MKFSFIIPVFNRPDEILELLNSLQNQTQKDFEVVIIDDGSNLKSDAIVKDFSTELSILYLEKENSGPGDSRNFGMKNASGDYFIILDSDCILPKDYFENVKNQLASNFVDCFGGSDSALHSFSEIQKAINYSMTSFLTTGGIRGGSEKLDKFQPRSFNMGLSKKAFEATNGFGNIHPGEDPDLSMRLWRLGFKTKLYNKTYVYHKRRIDWKKFYMQVNKFGKARPILDSWFPEYVKLTFWFPTLFLGYVVFTLGLFFMEIYMPFLFLCFYLLVVFLDSTIKNKSLKIGVLTLWALLIQFYGYGIGFIKSFIKIRILKREPKKAFPELFFK